jgi:hypothetical protein
MILQVNVRYHLNGRLPSQFNAEEFAHEHFKAAFAAIAPKYELDVASPDNTPAYTVHIHASTQLDMCNGCMSAAQDGEN